MHMYLHIYVFYIHAYVTQRISPTFPSEFCSALLARILPCLAFAHQPVGLKLCQLLLHVRFNTMKGGRDRPVV